MIGASVKARRLWLNLTQQTVAERSGVSLRAVKRMEAGGGSSVETMIAIARTLQMVKWLGEFEPRDEISPIALADAMKKAAKKKRQRASGKGSDVSKR